MIRSDDPWRDRLVHLLATVLALAGAARNVAHGGVESALDAMLLLLIAMLSAFVYSVALGLIGLCAAWIFDALDVLFGPLD